MVLEQIKELKIEKITPLAALNLFAQWKDELQKEK